MVTFNWEYLSFYKFDPTWVYREVLAIPLLVLVLWIGWMKMVQNARKEEFAEVMDDDPDSDYEVIDRKREVVETEEEEVSTQIESEEEAHPKSGLNAHEKTD